MITVSTKNIYSLVDLKMKVPFSYKQVLSCKALKLVADLHLNFNEKRLMILDSGNEQHNQIQLKKINRFLSELRPIRNDNGRMSDLQNEFKDRRISIVELTGRDQFKDLISLSSNLPIVDFETTHDPSWEKLIEGQIYLKDVICNNILSDSFSNLESETLVENMIPLMVRPRSLKSNENNLFIDNKPVSAAFFDIGIFLFNNAGKMTEKGFSPYFYLPGIGYHLESNFWDEVFSFIEEELNLHFGTIIIAS